MIGRTLLILALLVGALAPAAPAPAGQGAGLEAYRGLAAWVDIFEDRAWRRPVKAVADMASHGVRTLFLETSNYTQERSIAHPEGVARFIEAAHARQMDVVAWYLAGFKKLHRDFQRSMAAIRFRTGSGQRFDSFGLDIEASVVDPVSKRTRRLLALSRRLRSRVGPGYPLGAIIPSPRGIELADDYWPGFPYAELAGIYDVFVPMGYFTYHGKGSQRTHFDTVRNVEILRREVGDPTVPIHLIGGIADDASGEEVGAFVRAVREHGLLGASLYNWSLTRRHDWRELAAIHPNPRQSPALPVALGFLDPLGNVPGTEVTHPKEVHIRAGGLPGPRTLQLEAFDVQPGEVEVLANWESVGVLPQGKAMEWSTITVPLPDQALNDAGSNLITFVARGDHPTWSEWGVRAVSVI
jgi:hypothetical protein